MWLSTPRLFFFWGVYNIKMMLIKNFLPSYRASIAIVAAIVVLVVVIMLFPNSEKQSKNDREMTKESAKDILPAAITEETKRSLSERPPGTQDAVISEDTKKSLATRPAGAVDAVITPEVAKSLSERLNN